MSKNINIWILQNSAFISGKLVKGLTTSNFKTLTEMTWTMLKYQNITFWSIRHVHNELQYVWSNLPQHLPIPAKFQDDLKNILGVIMQGRSYGQMDEQTDRRMNSQTDASNGNTPPI